MGAIVLNLTEAEAAHLRMLMGKDIGWQRKYKTGKDVLASEIYRKLKEAEGKE